jgi:nucleotide-binding universal stress UspA family protein
MSIEGIVLIVVWVVSGVVGASVFYARSGRRSWFWLGTCLVLGPFGLPIAWEVSEQRPTEVVQRRSGHDRGGLRLLAAVDGSTEATDALSGALDLLGSRVGTLLLVHVIDYDTRALEGDAPVDRATAMLEGVASTLPVSAPSPTLQVAVGNPPDALVDLAERERVDLVVLGQRGTGLSRALVGSVADGVSGRSAVPVLLGSDQRHALR